MEWACVRSSAVPNHWRKQPREARLNTMVAVDLEGQELGPACNFAFPNRKSSGTFSGPPHLLSLLSVLLPLLSQYHFFLSLTNSDMLSSNLQHSPNIWQKWDDPMIALKLYSRKILFSQLLGPLLFFQPHIPMHEESSSLGEYCPIPALQWDAKMQKTLYYTISQRCVHVSVFMTSQR